jgi:hypothetical protein
MLFGCGLSDWTQWPWLVDVYNYGPTILLVGLRNILCAFQTNTFFRMYDFRQLRSLNNTNVILFP